MAPVNPGWELDKAGFRLFDGTTNDSGAPSGKGVTVEMPSATGNAFFRGTGTASRLQGKAGGAGGTGARMWFDFTAGDPQISPAGETPGVSPYWAITDRQGVRRVEAGLLATLGISPTQWGMRVNDAGSNPIWDSLGLIAVNSALLYDDYAIPLSGGTEIASIKLPTPAHVGVSYFAIATAQLTFSEPAAVPDTLSISITLDGAAPFFNFNFAGNPTNGTVATQSGPFTNVNFTMPTIFWTVTVNDLKPHPISVMAGSTGGTITAHQARLATLQFGN